MTEFFSFLIVLFLLPYLVVPIIIRRNQYFALKPQVRPVIDGFLPKAVEAYFNAQMLPLAALGFEHRIDAVSLDYGPHLKVFLRLLVAPQSSLIAMSTAIVPDGDQNPARCFIEISSRFLNGQEVSTHNSDLVGAPIEPRQKHVSVMPFVTDVAILVALHKRTCQRLQLSKEPAMVPAKGAEFDFLIQNFADDLARQVSLGCLQYDEANQCYRPTWAGAFLMGWYSMWPFGTVRRQLQKIRARIQIRALLKANA